MNWDIILSSTVTILAGTSLFVIPFLILKWFIMKEYVPKPVLYKITSNWDYLKGTVVSLTLGSLFFFGGSASAEFEQENVKKLTHEDAVAFFIVMALGGLIGVFVSHWRIRHLNEKEFYKTEKKLNKMKALGWL